jgi:hypothetical protein
MSTPEDGGRVSVSRDALRADLADLELRLVDRLSARLDEKADSIVLDAVRARVHALEGTTATMGLLVTQFGDQEGRLRSLERFRYAFPATSVLALTVATATLAFHLLTS